MNRWQDCFSLMLVICSLFVAGCSGTTDPSQDPAGQTLPVVTSETTYQVPSWWQENLTHWLRLAYVENEEWAAFGNVAAEVLVPSLYSTYPVVSILTATGQRVEQPSHIIAWINGLQNDKGAYDDPQNTAPALIETYWAVAALNCLGSSPPDPQAIVRFLSHQQQPNGLFVFHDLDLNETEDSHIAPIHFAIETLRLMGMRPDQVTQMLDLQETAQYLHSYISRQLSSQGPTIRDEKAGYLIGALAALAWIEPSLIPVQAERWLTNRITEAPSLPGDLISVAQINNLLDAAEALNLRQAKEPASLAIYLRDKVFPNQSLKGGFGSSPTQIDPMLTYEVVKLTTRVGASFPYPHFDKLLDALETHRIESGWITFFTFEPSVAATFYALALADRIGQRENFASSKLLCYLTAILEQGEEPGQATSHLSPLDSTHLYNLYYAVRAYRIVEGELPENLRAEVLTQDTQWVATSPPPSGAETEPTVQGLAFFALLARETGLEPDEASTEKLKMAAETLITPLEKGEILSIQQLYYLYALESILYTGEPLPHREAILQAVFNLRTEQGVFKRVPQVPIPDLDATYLATWLLQHLDGAAQIDHQMIIRFVNDCQQPYGFNYISSELLQSSGSNVELDFKVTYEGLELLDHYNVDN